MSRLDWLLFAAFLTYIIWDGVRRSRQAKGAEDYFLAGRAMPWWAMGLSIMATQASAITMIGTTGKGWEDGLRFLQFYFALPLAMIILCFTLVPLFHRLKVYTAYEYLGQRFDRKTRLLAALLFLILRGLSVGIVIYAPSVVLASLFGRPVQEMIGVMGFCALLYTALGGLRAVISTDVKQITVMFLGLVATVVIILHRLPSGVDFSGAMVLAREAGHLQAVDLRWDPSEKYTLWSSLLGGLFLFLAYFGSDQSQVQRFLSGKSLRHKQAALLFSGLLKVPFQLLVLICGILLFVFFLFQTPPASFAPQELSSLKTLEGGPQLIADHHRSYALAQAEAQGLLSAHRAGDQASFMRAAIRYRASLQHCREVRRSTRSFLEKSGSVVKDEVNYAFPFFILNVMPVGLVGLLIAAIFAAALSSIDSELNAMATVTVMDGYVYAFGGSAESPSILWVSRLATVFWGILATLFAIFFAHWAEFGSVIEAVNEIGSYFYGSLLGVFVLATLVPQANGHGAFWGLLTGMLSVWLLGSYTEIAWLYLNTVGTGVVVAVGVLVAWQWPQ
ncbi:MAG: hypothetical protein V3T77_00685 [Planctomycetota bacterium]